MRMFAPHRGGEMSTWLVELDHHILGRVHDDVFERVMFDRLSTSKKVVELRDSFHAG